MVCWGSGPVFPGAPGGTAFLEKRVAGLLASGLSLTPALSEVSDEAMFLEKRVARLLAGGWSLDPAFSVISGGAVFLEKRMTDSLAGDWLVALAG